LIKVAHPKAKSHQDLAGSLDNIEFERLQKGSREILKMRDTSHMTGKQAVDISKKGFMIHPGL